MLPDLHPRFTTWCLNLGATPSAATALWLSLEAYYSGPHRHYHHLGHIAFSLAEMDRCHAQDPALEGAIWFHDLIYDPHRSDNEDASREWFVSHTQAWLDPSLVTRISQLIDVTDFRKPRDDSDPLAALMVDIDLAILSAPPVDYDAYTAAIRREYAHVPDEAFRKGRSAVMAGFLTKPIYRTAFFTPRENQARDNITRELEQLAAS